MQDTLKQKAFLHQDTTMQPHDSSFLKNVVKADSDIILKPIHFQPLIKPENTDTISVCSRNSIADLTFYDSVNVITRIDERILQNFPFVFTEISGKKLEETKADLALHLKNGDGLPANLFQGDWILPLILLSTFILGIVKAESGRFFQGIAKFILFREINETTSREISSVFQWQSTLFNLSSFINISLFGFLTSLWFNILPFESKGIINWLMSFTITVSAFTARHILCVIIGNISGETEIFREYRTWIYQAYRLAGMLLLFLSVLILYTTLIPLISLFYAGFGLITILYLVRVFRLFLIFLNRHVSIFYLILYLCALEILPVVIIVKYVTG
jgi:hypothetical protein